MDFLNNMVAQPGAAIFIYSTMWLVSIFLLRCILSDLMKMHKSKSTVKKIGRQYTFRQKLALRHVAEHTEHAVTFTRRMIFMHHLSFWTMVAILFSRLFLSDRWFVYLLTGRLLLFDVPVMVLDFLLDNHPFNTRKRRGEFKHRRRFQKYHNTSDRTSLF